MIYLHIYIYKCAGTQPCIYSYAHNPYTTVARRFVNNKNTAVEAAIQQLLENLPIVIQKIRR
jgi:hypothetical protein